MVLANLSFTQAGDDLPKGTKVPRAKPRKKRRDPGDSSTPAMSGRGTPASVATQDYAGTKKTQAEREMSSPPLFDWSDDGETSQVRTPARAHNPLTEPISIGETVVEEEIISTTEAIVPPDGEDVNDDPNALILDPKNSERQYRRDPFTGINREVWRPGDPDGVRDHDYYMRPGPTVAMELRYRFYQSSPPNGPVSLKNMPPKYVFLDDRAVYEVARSDIPRSNAATYWPHDFGGSGKIRPRRAHRGRPAILNPDEEGSSRYHWGEAGGKKEKHYFSGEKDYVPIIYRTVQPAAATTAVTPGKDVSKKRKATSPASGEEPGKGSNPSSAASGKKKGHNQYTPKEEMVKHGAPSEAKGRERYRARINTFLRRSASPEWAKDRSKLYGGVGDQARAFTASMALQSAMGAASGAPDLLPEPGREGSIWVEQEDAEADSETEFPFAREPLQAHVSEAGVRQEDVSEETAPPRGQPRRKRAAQPMSYMERLAAEPTTMERNTTSPADHIVQTVDSGSYATQLEQQLVRANEEISALTSTYEEAQGHVLKLKEQVSTLQAELQLARESAGA